MSKDIEIGEWFKGSFTCRTTGYHWRKDIDGHLSIVWMKDGETFVAGYEYMRIPLPVVRSRPAKSLTSNLKPR